MIVEVVEVLLNIGVVLVTLVIQEVTHRPIIAVQVVHHRAQGVVYPVEVLQGHRQEVVPDRQGVVQDLRQDVRA